jgi:hypothetical protein
MIKTEYNDFKAVIELRKLYMDIIAETHMSMDCGSSTNLGSCLKKIHECEKYLEEVDMKIHSYHVKLT